MKKTLIILIATAIVLSTLTGCLPGDGKSTSDKPAGFWSGIWHGWIAPVSLVWELFDKDIRVYEKENSGWWYDFGFYIAIVGGFGGISFSRSVSRRRKKE